MIMITGGKCQGKRTFALDLIEKRTQKTEETLRIADGRTDTVQDACEADVIVHFEMYVRHLMETGNDPGIFTEKLLENSQKKWILTDEIGCGVVPADAFERNYRETDGRLCQRLAFQAEEVYRVVCGLGVRIK